MAHDQLSAAKWVVLTWHTAGRKNVCENEPWTFLPQVIEDSVEKVLLIKDKSYVRLTI